MKAALNDSTIPTATRARPVWLHVGQLFDGIGRAPGKDVHIVYTDTEIRFVGLEGRHPPPSLLAEGQRAPDFSDQACTLLPGLIEAHAHLFLEGGELDLGKRAEYLKLSADQLFEKAKDRLPKLARLGLAGVRDAGDKDGVGLRLSQLQRSCERGLIPCYDSPGAAINHQGRYGSFMADALENYGSLDECVAARIRGGAQRIKIIPTGIINFKKGRVTTEPQMTTEEVAGLVAAARKRGVQTFAHASGDDGIDRAIEGGVDTVEHGFFIREDQLGRMRDQDVGWVPTFAPVQVQIDHADRMGWDAEVVKNLQAILELHGQRLRKAHDLGVTIIAGSDAGSCGVAHGYGFLDELELMERYGLPSSAVLKAATGASAGRLRFQDKIGEIEPGNCSRFIMTRFSPLETVRNLRKDRVVVFDGAAIEVRESDREYGL